MVKTLTILTLLFLTLLTSSHECIHDKIQHDIKVADPEYAMYDVMDGRALQTYQNIRILVDQSNLSGVSAAFKDYIMNSLMPPVVNFLQAAVQVPVRRTKLKAGGYSTLCSGSISIPSTFNTNGVDNDLIIFVTAQNSPSSSYVASAIACLLDTSTTRPIIGKITYNLAQVAIAESDAQREQDIVTSIHELTHVLGFSSSLYPYYRNPSTGKALTNHYYSKTIMGYPATVLSLDPLNQRLRNHFNCSSVEGAYLENQGGSGSAGSHFERRIFYNEYMTSSAILDTRITEFTLALLEGTGWYQVNYAMAEPITWGKNKGCNFITGDCMDKTTKTSNFEEFCSPLLSRSCSWTGRAGSSCGAFTRTTDKTIPSAINWWGNYTISQDSYSDNCPIQLTYKNLDCEDSSNQYSSTISAETYGYGSKCFMSTLYQGAKLTSNFPYCFKSKCQKDSKGNFYIEVGVGSTTVKCTSAKSVTVTGYTGSLVCPDPQSFCAQATSEGYCRRGCSARGSCVNQECVCNDGWTGFDCSYSTSVDNSGLCQSDPLRTTRSGDNCICSSTNTTCMCLLGLQTGTECDIYFPSEETPITELEETEEVPETPEIPETPDVPETPENNNNSTTTATEEQNTGTNSTTTTSNDGTDSTTTSSPETNSTDSSEGTNSTDSSEGTNSTDSSEGTNSTETTGDLNPSKTNTTNSTDSKISETLNEKENSSSDLVSNNKKPNVAIIAAISGVIGAILVILGIVFLWKYSKRIRRSQTQTQPQRSKTWMKKPPRLTIPIKIIDDVSNTSSAQHSPEFSRTGSLRSAQDSPIMYRGGSPSKARIVGHSRFRNYSPEVRDRRVVDDEQHQGFGLAIKPLGYNGTHGDEIDSPGIPVPRSKEGGGQGFGLVLKPIEIGENGENHDENDVENPMNEAEVIHPETISIKSVPIIPQEVKVEENHQDN